MSVELIVNDLPFEYPEKSDENWGVPATGWATAVTNLLDQFRSGSAPFADDGVIRLGQQDKIEWRNNADDDNIKLYVDTDDFLYYQLGSDTPINLTANASGNVTGPGSSTDNAIARFNGTSGQLIQNSLAKIEDDGDLTYKTDLVLSKTLVPIGTIIWHYDFDGAIVPDSTYWVPCDGGTYTIGGVSRVTPDLSARYLCGFGTENGGNIDTAPWSTTPVGNASQEINLAHTHTGPLHQHGINSETSFSTNAENSHTHGVGTLKALMDNTLATNKIYTQQVAATAWSIDKESAVSGTATPGGNATHGVPLQGTSGAGSSHLHSIPNHDHGGQTANGGNGATGSALSATQSIQPRSILARAFMRAK